MVKSVLDKKCHFLGRMPKNVKFEVVKTLSDGSYMSWIAPDRKSKKKGAKRISVRIIEYVIEEKGQDNENYLFFSWLITEIMSEIIPH